MNLQILKKAPVFFFKWKFRNIALKNFTNQKKLKGADHFHKNCKISKKLLKNSYNN